MHFAQVRMGVWLIRQVQSNKRTDHVVQIKIRNAPVEKWYGVCYLLSSQPAPGVQGRWSTRPAPGPRPPGFPLRGHLPARVSLITGWGPEATKWPFNGEKPPGPGAGGVGGLVGKRPLQPRACACPYEFAWDRGPQGGVGRRALLEQRPLALF